MAYHFVFETAEGLTVELPIPPSSVSMSQKTNNETINLINGGEFNVLKSPALKEISFDFYIPQVQYPFASKLEPPTTYTAFFESCMENQKPVLFTIVREMPSGRQLVGTREWMAIEKFSTQESWEEGFDFVASIEMKQYKPYGTVVYEIVKQDNQTTASPSTDGNKRVEADPPTKHKVVKGDTLWGLARKYYGIGNEGYWTAIYNANKELIEKTAKKYGKASSSNGHWIYPNTELVIPKFADVLKRLGITPKSGEVK